MNKIIAITYFKAESVVGISLIKTFDGDYKAYIGCTNDLWIPSEQIIIGTHFPLKEAISLCSVHGTVFDIEIFNEIVRTINHQELQQIPYLDQT